MQVRRWCTNSHAHTHTHPYTYTHIYAHTHSHTDACSDPNPSASLQRHAAAVLRSAWDGGHELRHGEWLECKKLSMLVGGSALIWYPDGQ